MKINWEIVPYENIERLRELFDNPGDNCYIIRQSSQGWMKCKMSKPGNIINTQILSGLFPTLEECQAYITKIEE